MRGTKSIDKSSEFPRRVSIWLYGFRICKKCQLYSWGCYWLRSVVFHRNKIVICHWKDDTWKCRRDSFVMTSTIRGKEFSVHNRDTHTQVLFLVVYVSGPPVFFVRIVLFYILGPMSHPVCTFVFDNYVFSKIYRRWNSTSVTILVSILWNYVLSFYTGTLPKVR